MQELGALGQWGAQAAPAFAGLAPAPTSAEAPISSTTVSPAISAGGPSPAPVAEPPDLAPSLTPILLATSPPLLPSLALAPAPAAPAAQAVLAWAPLADVGDEPAAAADRSAQAGREAPGGPTPQATSAMTVAGPIEALVVSAFAPGLEPQDAGRLQAAVEHVVAEFGGELDGLALNGVALSSTFPGARDGGFRG